MSKNLVTPLFLASCFVVAACSGDGGSVEGESALENSESFREARDFVRTAAATHTSSVMSRDSLADVTLDEVRFHERSIDAIDQMGWRLRLMATCRSPDGELLDTTDALAAVAELRVELGAHKIGMITMVDGDTAKAAEMVFEARQAPLFEELGAYCDYFESLAATYDCAF